MSNIGPGDLVVCVDASPRQGFRPAPCSFLEEGRYYLIAFAGQFRGIPGVLLKGDPNNRMPGYEKTGWHADRFRKLNDEPDNAELIARIRKCKPMKTEVA